MIGRLVLLVAAAVAAAGAAVFGRRKARQRTRARRRAERQAKRARVSGAASAATPAMTASPLPDVAPGPPAAAASQSGAEARQTELPGDAFLAITGIGPATQERLLASGVTSVAQVAAWSDDDIEAIAAGLKVKPERIRREAWVEQAQAIMAAQRAAD